MKLIIGLGNPGTKYKLTRHNVGFMLVDALAQRRSATFQDKPKFKASTTETTIEDEKVLLVKPATFYNLAGESVRIIRDFYKLENSDILVIHDDLALPFGSIRTRLSGSDAGNNGIKSLNQHLGQGYTRIRVGIFSELREQVEATDFVLGKLSPRQRTSLMNALPNIAAITKSFAAETKLEPHTITFPTTET
jgi:PTH1 family peptidyl-tRNA hydrolase